MATRHFLSTLLTKEVRWCYVDYLQGNRLDESVKQCQLTVGKHACMVKWVTIWSYSEVLLRATWVFGMRISSKRAKVRAGVTNESITGKKQLIVTSSKPTDRQFIDQ